MAWWRDTWGSEVARNYIHVDIHGLYRLARLVDRYNVDADAGLDVRMQHAEIRLAQQAYGQTPLDRTRLQWEVELPPKVEDEAKGDDPPQVLVSRQALRALK
jgi:hypothetical protein